MHGRRSLFKTFPKVLVVNARRFELVNWVPTKLDIPVVVDDTPFPLDEYISKGLQADEETLPEDDEPVAPAFTPNADAMSQLTGMGFPAPRCEKALYHTGNSNAEEAMNWLFAHMDDADIDEPLFLPKAGAATGGAEPSAELIEMLGAMGFSAAQAKKALKETGGDMERAVDWLFNHPDDSGEEAPTAEASAESKEDPGSTKLPAVFQLDSIVCHKGSSVHAGHYVAFVKKHLEDDKEGETSWVLFNDEKVVKAVDVDEMKKFAYVYLFRRTSE